MRFSSIVAVALLVLAAGGVSADQPFNQYTDVPPGTQPGTPQIGNPNEAGSTEALVYWADRASFEAAFPGLPTEDWSNTLVAAGAIVSCAPPFNSSTSNACFAPGGILAGLELNVVNVTGGTGELVVLGAGAFGNTNVLVGPNSFGDDMVLNFSPAVRAAGLDLVNPVAPGNVYSVSVYGPGGVLDTTNVTDGPEGTFWGVDSDDVGGITSIVFEGFASEAHSELSSNVIFGGEPVPVELQSFDVE